MKKHAKSHFKTPSETGWLRCRPPQKAHPHCVPLRRDAVLSLLSGQSSSERRRIGLRLAFNPDLRF